MSELSELPIGTVILDNDPRSGHRTGVILEVDQVRVRVNWGRSRTWVRRDRIGRKGATGYSVQSVPDETSEQPTKRLADIVEDLQGRVKRLEAEIEKQKARNREPRRRTP